VFVRSSLVELRCPCRDVGEAIPVASLRPIRTACKTLGGHILEHPSCGGFMPTAETTLISASGNQRAAKKSLTSDARLDNEANVLNDVRFWGVKRTLRFQGAMSAFDPKRTWADC
jgi:hypothetical protein